MNTDIRIPVSFRNHRKRRKLALLVGDGATGYLIDLWIGTAANRPSGELHGWDEMDIALEANYPGDAKEFVAALVQVGFLDVAEDGTYLVHDWVDHNGYASDADTRSEVASKNQIIRWAKKHLKVSDLDCFKQWLKNHPYKKGTGYKEVLSEYKVYTDSIRSVYDGNTNGNTPSPLPYPSPLPSLKDICIVPQETCEHDEQSREPVPEPEEPERGEKQKQDTIPYREIIDHLNDVCGCGFKPTTKGTRQLIRARWNEGFRLTDFKSVISCKFGQWGTDSEMCSFLRPQTLFSNKFEAYLNEAKKGGKGSVRSDIEQTMQKLKSMEAGK